MKNLTLAGTALILSTTSAFALGLDRSGQPIGVIFEDGRYAEFSMGFVQPSLDGTDVATVETGNVSEDYSQFGFAYKMDINPQMSFALIFDEPYGVDLAYPAAADGGSPVLGGTAARLDSQAITALLRYKVNENFSVHGGLRSQAIDAEITLDGAAYGALAGYNVVLESSRALGYSLGAAYERPDIALRVALTYHSEMEHSFGTTEFGAPSPDTTVTTPQAVNLDFQTGIAADTLLFGNIRWAEYSKVIVSPAVFAGATGGGSLTDIDDGVSYNIGVGRRITDDLSASISVGYEAASEDDLVSPLSPSNGNYSIALGGQYQVNENVTISGGIRYVMLGDAMPETADTARADFTDNSALGIGFKVGYTF